MTVLIASALPAALTGKQAENYVTGQRIFWAGITLLVMNFGAAGGMFAFSWLTSFTGRKSAFAVTFLAVVAAVWLAVKAWKHRWLRGNFVADLRRRVRETAR